MLYIKHQPYFAEIENTGTLTFSTELYSYCHNTIYSDSVFVYLRVDGGEYEAYNMEYLENNTWEVKIGGLPSGLIEYYVFAADESGRRECHPYIGAPDPHKFILIGTPPTAPILSLDKTESSVYSEELTVIEDFITVSNLGNADLIIEITDIDFSEILTITPHHGTIPEGDSLIITLSYNFNNIAKIEEYVGSFKLLSNDALNLEVEISLHATLDLGIDEANISEIVIYPNPTTGVVEIAGQARNDVRNIEIFDVYGRPVGANLRVRPNAKEPTINISHLNPGIYFVKITTDSGQFVVKKILKL